MNPSSEAGPLASDRRPMTSPGVVDSHAHIWPIGLMHPSQVAKEPLAAEASDLVAAIDKAKVDVVVATPASIYEKNDFVLAAAIASAGRIYAVALINPWDHGAVDELKACAAQGAIGVRIAPRSIAGGFATDRGPLADLLDVAADLRLVVQWTLPLGSVEPIEFAAARLPNLLQVLDHMGLPADATNLASLARIRALAAIPGLHAKMSGFYALSRTGYPYVDTWPWAAGTVDAFGASRTIWASDWPLSTESADYAAQQALVALLPFQDGESRDSILSDTARKLWRLPRGNPAHEGG